MSTRLLEMADWAARLTTADVPPRVLERARLQRTATTAAARAGARTPGAARIRAALRGWAGRGPASVVGERYKLEPSAAVYANAVASIAHDWDDYLYMGHTGHSAVWVSQAIAEAVGADDDAQLAAQVVANELSGRLGAALFIGPHNGQFWASIHCIGAAAAAAKLAGLDPDRIAHAMAIALYQPPYGLWPGFMGPETKLLTAAEPAAQGVRAAALAAEGTTGPLDVLDDARGMLAHFSFVSRPAMLDALGAVWLTDTLAFKPFPGCAYLQAAVEALLRLREEHAFGADDVEAIDVAGGYLTTGMEELSAGPALTPVRVNFSVALSLAVALDAGRLTDAELRDEHLAERESQLRELAARVRLEHDWDLTLATLRGALDGLPARAALGQVPAGRWLALPRRMRELHMDELTVGAGDLVELLRRPDVRRSLAGGLRPGARNGSRRGLAALDVDRLRLTFPVRVAVRLRGGRVLEADGREPGACGDSVESQRAVVERKAQLIG